MTVLWLQSSLHKHTDAPGIKLFTPQVLKSSSDLCWAYFNRLWPIFWRVRNTNSGYCFPYEFNFKMIKNILDSSMTLCRNDCHYLSSEKSVKPGENPAVRIMGSVLTIRSLSALFCLTSNGLKPPDVFFSPICSKFPLNKQKTHFSSIPFAFILKGKYIIQ